MTDINSRPRNQSPSIGAAWWAAEGRAKRAVAMAREGMPRSAIAAELGTTKSAVIGFLYRHGPKKMILVKKPPSTIFDRLAALHAKTDAVLAATAGQPRRGLRRRRRRERNPGSPGRGAMSSRIMLADDSAAIARRLAELWEERTAELE